MKYARRFETKLAYSRMFEVTQVTPQFFATFDVFLLVENSNVRSEKWLIMHTV